MLLPGFYHSIVELIYCIRASLSTPASHLNPCGGYAPPTFFLKERKKKGGGVNLKYHLRLGHYCILIFAQISILVFFYFSHFMCHPVSGIFTFYIIILYLRILNNDHLIDITFHKSVIPFFFFFFWGVLGMSDGENF